MKLVVDSNRVFAALIKNSVSRKILMDQKFKFVGIYFSKQEVKKYEQVILQKAKINRQQYLRLFDRLFSKIELFDENIIEEKYAKEAYNTMKEIDEKDTSFLALALQEKCYIWSDGKHFKQQNKIKVLTTKELSRLL